MIKHWKLESHVLVKFCSGSRRTQIYRYVCSVLEVRAMELKVMGFKELDRKNIFKAVEDDVSVS
jgi:hypothetical protein